MIKISLNKLKLFGYHGLHQEEKLTGAEFEVSMDVYFDVSERITHLHETVDYTVLYNIVRERLNEPAELLETIVQDISARVSENLPQG
jgi:dihydroneopterin aldolase